MNICLVYEVMASDMIKIKKAAYECNLRIDEKWVVIPQVSLKAHARFGKDSINIGLYPNNEGKFIKRVCLVAVLNINR